jgi:hypothetical protein
VKENGLGYILGDFFHELIRSPRTKQFNAVLSSAEEKKGTLVAKK